MPVVFVRILNPKQPGESLVLAKDDFDPAVHTLWTPETITPAPETDISADDTNTATGETKAATGEMPAPAKPKRERKPKATAAAETT